VFSSSATVYGSAESPVTEEQTVGQGITNPSLPPFLPPSLPPSLVFSFSATVYGSAESPVTEEQTVGRGVTNPSLPPSLPPLPSLLLLRHCVRVGGVSRD